MMLVKGDDLVLVRSADQGGFSFGAVELEEIVLHPYGHLLQTDGEF